MTPADHANTVREKVPHYVEGNLVTGATDVHSENCPGCAIEPALDALQAQATGIANWELVADANRRAARAAEDERDAAVRQRDEANAKAIQRADALEAAEQAAEQARNALERCPLCTHEWRRHDPEDGKCDAPADGAYGACPCGRDPAFHRVRNASLSKLALDATADARIARAALAGNQP